MIRTLSLIIACASLYACAPTEEKDSLLLREAWVRAIPPGSMMTAGFGRLVNDGTGDLVISHWSSDDFADVSLHRTVDENGVSRMKSVPELTLQTGAELVLEPGGYHLMLMKPVRSDLETVTVRVEVSGGKQFEFYVPVERR